MRSHVNRTCPAYEKWLRFGQNRHSTPIFHWLCIVYFGTIAATGGRSAGKKKWPAAAVTRRGPRSDPALRRIGPMVKLASDAPIVKPPARHGTCRLQITIGGTSYSLRPIPAQPRGVTVWVLRALDGPRAGARYTVASVNRAGRLHLPRSRDQRRDLQTRHGPAHHRPYPPFRPHRARGIGHGNGPRRPPPRQGPRRPGRPHPRRPAGRRPTSPALGSRPAGPRPPPPRQGPGQRKWRPDDAARTRPWACTRFRRRLPVRRPRPRRHAAAPAAASPTLAQIGGAQ